MKTYREHPLRVLRYSAKNVWLMVFPLLRSLNAMRLDANRLYAWVRGAWFDILTIAVIVAYGYARWKSSEIRLTKGAIVHEAGVVLKTRKTIPFSRISSSTIERPFYLAPFRAVYVRCDTSAGVFHSSDMKTLVRESDCAAITSRLPGVKRKKRRELFPKPTLASIILFSIFFSSGFTGTVYVATFFYKGGNIARGIVSRSMNAITGQTEKISNSFWLKIPDAAVVIGTFFVCSWIVSFLINVARYSRFRINADDKTLFTSYGFFTRREFRITKSQINYVDLRQNLIMKLFGAVTVHISCAGYGVGRSLPVLAPVKKEKDLAEELSPLTEFKGEKNEYRPKPTGFWQYIWQPAIISMALVPAYFLSKRFFPGIAGLIFFMAVMFEIPAIWFVIVKTGAFFTSGLSIYDDKIIVRCCKWSGFHTIIADRGKLVKLELEQTLFQKIGKRCSVSLWFEGEKKVKYKAKAFDEKNAKTISELLDSGAHIQANLGLKKFF